ncbi:MAG: 50S ribosomal protein L29 [Acidobacteriota bacterium]
MLSELRLKSIDDLLSLEKEMKIELAKLSIRKNMGVREAANKIPSLRKNIARVKTIIVEKRCLER